MACLLSLTNYLLTVIVNTKH